MCAHCYLCCLNGVVEGFASWALWHGMKKGVCHSLFDLALNGFISFNFSLTLLFPSMASSLTLLKSISQKYQVISNRLGKTIKNYNSTWEVPAKDCHGWLTSALSLLDTVLGDVADKTDIVFCLVF